MSDPKDIIIGEISNTVSKLVGSSAAAVMRQAGAAASHKLWPDLPQGKSMDEAGAIMREGVGQLGGFGDFQLEGDGNGGAKITFKQCFFAAMAKDSGQACGQQAICHFGFGLVEETLHRLTGTRARVELGLDGDGAVVTA
ncbi:MAG: hypothetical protein ACOC1F_02385, partial [Myxococcota bacterium]